LPVIATERMGAALEFVETGRNGWLIRADDEQTLLTAMREAASMELDQLRDQARASVSMHTLQNGAARFVQYAHLAADHTD
jgi:glycosyltransferase involved in cell wall biosynthesis